MTLLVCRTCPRYDPRATGEFSRALAAAIAADPAGDEVDVRGVQCLGGCPRHGVVAVDGPGKVRVRFAGLDAGDAEAILEAAAAHDASPTGDPGDWRVPERLAGRVSAVTPKRAPRRP
jgi:predicted metal-binding protein